MKCNGDCFNCVYDDCIVDYEAEKRKERNKKYYEEHGKELARKRKENDPKCLKCKFFKSLKGANADKVFYCGAEMRQVKNNTVSSPYWCPKRKDKTFGMTPKEKRLYELDKKIVADMKARKRLEDKRKKSIDKALERRNLIREGICPKCKTRKVETGKCMCRMCLNKALESTRQYRIREEEVS